MQRAMCGGHKAAWVLLLVGGLNWGLIGAFDLNLVDRLFGSVIWLERLVYILVGVSALMMLGMKRCCYAPGTGRSGGCAGCRKEPCECRAEGRKQE